MKVNFHRYDVFGYAKWISFLCSGDTDKLSKADMAECLQWLAFHNLKATDCIGIVEGPAFGQPTWLASKKPDSIYEYIFHSDKK